jgi:hypothetical protein
MWEVVRGFLLICWSSRLRRVVAVKVAKLALRGRMQPLAAPAINSGPFGY